MKKILILSFLFTSCYNVERNCIDFKTGERSDKDKDQISEYANALTQMGNTVVKKFLIYTSDPIKIIQL